ncbi:MAG: hypothetical protein WD709_03285, partial [Gammaproteobacteria bacterium]
AYDTLNQAEQAMQKWQDEWDAFKEADAGFRQQIEVGNARVAHLQESLEEIRYRTQTLVSEKESGGDEELERLQEELGVKLAVATEAVESARTDLSDKQQNVRHCRDRIHTLTEKLADMRTRQQKLEGTLAALIPLQQGEAGETDPGIQDWISSFAEESPPRLLEQINVEPEWAQALETVLGQHLQSVVVNDFDSALTALSHFNQGNIGIISVTGTSQNTSTDSGLPRMIDKVVSGTPLDQLLGRILLADDVTSALAIYPQLGDSESVVTRSGIWIGKGWIRVSQHKSEDSILLREKKIQGLKSENDALLSEIADMLTQLDSARSGLEQAEAGQQQAQKNLGELQENLASLQSQYAEIRTHRQQIIKRTEQIEEDLESLQSREDSARQELEGIEKMLGRTGNDQTDLLGQKAKLVELREKHQSLLDRARSDWQTTHEHSHEIAL